MATYETQMTTLQKTLIDIKTAKKKHNFKYKIVRMDNRLKDVSDLDVLVPNSDFKKFTKGLVEMGYSAESHDHALGGRVPGAQINLIKKQRIKIDLHKDFTWRGKKYLDLNLIWRDFKNADEFLVFINIIFEKTYIDAEDFLYVWKKKSEIFKNRIFYKQAKKYGWLNTFENFKNWETKSHKAPIFLPVALIIRSYVEKFNLKSLAYYIFFRSRYIITKQLPYD